MSRIANYINTPPKPTKAQEHEEIDRQVREFLKKGGKIKKIPTGETIYNTDGSKKFGYREEE